jgi:hypothetical protein
MSGLSWANNVGCHEGSACLLALIDDTDGISLSAVGIGVVVGFTGKLAIGPID